MDTFRHTPFVIGMYMDQVLNCRVKVLLRTNKQEEGKQEGEEEGLWLEGEICQVRIKVKRKHKVQGGDEDKGNGNGKDNDKDKDKDEQPEIRHCIELVHDNEGNTNTQDSDCDSSNETCLWVNLMALEKQKRLQWIDEKPKKYKIKTEKIKQETEVKKEEEKNDKTEPKEQNASTILDSTTKRKRNQVENHDEEQIKEHDNKSKIKITHKRIKREKEEHSSVKVQAKTKSETQRIKLENDDYAKDTDTDNDNDNDPLVTATEETIGGVMPDSLSAIIRLMDQLQPGQNYYKRQQDTRNECSKVRSRLRKLARENNKHPATASWRSTGRWRPPDIETLRALMTLIRDMINESW